MTQVVQASPQTRANVYLPSVPHILLALLEVPAGEIACAALLTLAYHHAWPCRGMPMSCILHRCQTRNQAQKCITLSARLQNKEARRSFIR